MNLTTPNPYQPSLHLRKAESAAFDGPPRKPARVSLLQSWLLLQATRSAYLSVSEATASPASFWADWTAFDSAHTAGWYSIVVVLIFALQRLVPQPQVFAPVLAALWCLNSIVWFVWGFTADPTLSEFFVFDVFLAIDLASLALKVWFAGSLFFHARTRAYLRWRGVAST